MSEQNNPSSTGPEGTVPVNDAIQWAANWRTYVTTSGQAFNSKAFLIPIIDLKNILLYNPDAEAVRAYIGLDSPTDPSTAKLLLVPVVDGQDVLILQSDTEELGEDGQSNIYDLTKACPPYCATESLMHDNN